MQQYIFIRNLFTTVMSHLFNLHLHGKSPIIALLFRTRTNSPWFGLFWQSKNYLKRCTSNETPPLPFPFLLLLFSSSSFLLFFFFLHVKQQVFYLTFSSQCERKEFNCIMGIAKKQKQGEVRSLIIWVIFSLIPQPEAQSFIRQASCLGKISLVVLESESHLFNHFFLDGARALLLLEYVKSQGLELFKFVLFQYLAKFTELS